MKYAEGFVDCLTELGYTHCFFVAGGNIMHLLDAVRTRMTCVPFVHEVSAGIAAEAFNEAARAGRRAFVLVTAGPGLTNLVTAIAGAWLESRELLVVGGQVKRIDLSRGLVRQRGIQEVDGVAIVRPITVAAVRMAKSRRWSYAEGPGGKARSLSRFRLTCRGLRSTQVGLASYLARPNSAPRPPRASWMKFASGSGSRSAPSFCSEAAFLVASPRPCAARSNPPIWP